MNQNQIQAIEELKTTLQRVEAEGILIVVGNAEIHLADYKELESNGFYEVGEADGADSDLSALRKSNHVTIETMMLQILDSSRFHGGGA